MEHIIKASMCHNIIFDHYAKSHDMTSQRALFWRTFVLTIFAQKYKLKHQFYRLLKQPNLKKK